MRYRTRVFSYISAILILFFSIFCCSCVDNKPISERELLRLHIRADSNDSIDQAVKLKVRDDVVAYLAEISKGISTFDEAYKLIADRLEYIQLVAAERLRAEGMSYTAWVSLTNEYFPTRSYNGVVLESGYYDALIINLGSGKGDNWWCVVYPPLCYLEATDDFEYKSKILELVRQYF
ncbi:MAG: hypothetical protein E7350_02915 [Clostridiales bacterium]|nr:hypothetical protein [Clostridiales bacterium]